VRHYKPRKVTFQQNVLIKTTCDRCGDDEHKAPGGYLVPIAIEVNYGGEFGRRDEYDYCNNCLGVFAAFLANAGSRSFLVTGEDPGD
jgi:hypothetical protein